MLFKLPVMPLRSFIQLAEILHDQAERELRNPASVRRQLEEAEHAQVSGEISDDDLAHVEGVAVGRLLDVPATAPARTTSPVRRRDSHG